jgi:hypothetical protein
MEIKNDDLIPVHAQIEISEDMNNYQESKGIQEIVKEDTKKQLAWAIAEELLNNDLINFRKDDLLGYGTRYCANVIIFKPKSKTK